MTHTASDQNLKAAGSYVLWFISGILVLMVERHNRFIRFHAMQSTLTFGFFLILYWFLPLIPGMGFFVPILNFSALILWILLLVKAYQGIYFKLPYIGDFAEKQLSKI